MVARLLMRGETEAIEHPRYGAVGDIMVGGLPIRMTGSFTGFDRAAPWLGQHNDAVYGDVLGLSAEERAALEAAGVI